MAKPILEISGLTIKFGELTANENVSFTVGRQEIVSLIGPNGAGKTTLFNGLTGFAPPSAGQVLYYDPVGVPHDITGLPSHEICAYGITRTFQVVKTFDEMTVEENVMTGAFTKSRSRRAVRRQAEKIMEMTGLLGIAAAPCGGLTLAERKRVEIARALATQPRVLMLDECMAGLRPEELRGVMTLIKSLREQGLTFLIVEHIMEAIMPISDKVVVLSAGRKIAEGDPEQITGDPEVIKAYLGEKYVRD